MAEIAGFLYGAWNLECLRGWRSSRILARASMVIIVLPLWEKTGWDPVDLVTSELGLSEAQGCLWGHALHAGGTREGC